MRRLTAGKCEESSGVKPVFLVYSEPRRVLPMRVTTLKLPDDLRQRLKRVSEESGASVSWILRKAAERWLDEREASKLGRLRKEKLHHE
jgi:predicted DNA-binding protein